MTPEAWIFLGTSVTVIGALLGEIIRRQGKQSKQLGNDDDPTLRALVQSALAEIGQSRVEESEYHARQDAAMSKLHTEVETVRSDLGTVRTRVDRIEAILGDA